MHETKSYFFCGIGGSGMLPLALIVQGSGAEVAGSDRTLDQGRLGSKFDFLAERGIRLFAQDGSGITSSDQILVTSAAIEDSVPDVAKARSIGAQRITRPELLAQLFNASKTGIAVGGTSGKSTVTGMIGWILHSLGRDPTVMNGAVMKNFISPEFPFASALVGSGELFVSEVDESDGSIALYRPDIAVLNNISLDHKSLDELRRLFGDFAGKARTVIVNLDDVETRLLASGLPKASLLTCSLEDPGADLYGQVMEEQPFAITLSVEGDGEKVDIHLKVPGRHNAQNAMSALAAVRAANIPLREAAEAIEGFTGLRRRFERVGEAGGVSLIDDFGHNPDKIAATLKTLHAFPGRLLIFFQPHGYGPLRVMKDELIATFGREMAAEDRLILCDPAYFGGTTDRGIGSEAVVSGVADLGRKAEHIADRERCADRLAELARHGDRIIVMGARDDSLSLFAESLVTRLGRRSD